MEESTANRPKWLLELENRKRKPRLAHEAGAGAPCMNCNSTCPGLDLHFWRKICKNCKCSRDDHDVDDDEFPQFDLLFGPSGKFKKKPIRLYVNNKKQNENETFEWVPPNTTKELAMDYMKALPVEKLPIKGSAGAALRKQLLQKQLPLHDIDHQVCDELSEQEQKQFEKYLENIKKYVGQGKVMKILSARPFDRSLMTPINATDMQRYSPQHKPYVPSTGVQLRTPSSFANPYAKYPCEMQNNQDVLAMSDNNISDTEKYNYSLANVSVNDDIARSQPIDGRFYSSQHTNDTTPINDKGVSSSKSIVNLIPTHLAEQEIVSARAMHISGNYVPYGGASKCPLTHLKEHREMLGNATSYLPHSKIVNSEAVSIAESMLADALLPPSAIHANDIIGSTLDEKGLMFIREKLTDKYNAVENPVMHAASKLSGPLEASDILHIHSDGSKESNTAIADVNKEAERAAIIAATRCPAGTLIEKPDIVNTALEAETCKPFSHIVQSTTIAPTDTNEQCSKLLNPKESNESIVEKPIVMLESALDPLNKHKPADLHVSLESSSRTGSRYPVNDIPLQAELNSSVLQPSVIHSEQLQTQVFPHSIVGGHDDDESVQQLKDTMETLKVDSVRAQNCQKCHEDIRVGDVVVILEKANNASWHPGCFVCSVCDELLADLVYFHYKNKLYCGRHLAAFLGIPRCFACDELIFVREYTVAEGHNYHVKHFCCWYCDMPLAGQQYISENDRPLCLPCYQKTYAKICAACNVIIAADQQGVAIKNLNFHATETCFCCYSCRKNLLNGRMAIKEDKLFCSRECIAKFLNQ